MGYNGNDYLCIYQNESVYLLAGGVSASCFINGLGERGREAVLFFLRQPFDGAQDKAQDSVQSQNGQGLVEYAFILVLVAMIVFAILLILGPAVGNVFSNVVANL